MTSDGTILGVYEFLTSRAFRKVQERAIQSSGEKVMVMHKHKEMEQHIRPHTCMPEEQIFGCFAMHMRGPRTYVGAPRTCMGGESEP